jgi:hypothetical protein
MPNLDSTAVRELIDDVARRPVDRESGDDMLFRERNAAPRRVRRTSRHDVQVLPRPAIDDALTMRVRRQDTHYSAAKLALPFGLLAVLGVLIGLAVTSKSKSEDLAKAESVAAATAPQSANPMTPTSNAVKSSTPAASTTGTKSESTTGATSSTGATASSATTTSTTSTKSATTVTQVAPSASFAATTAAATTLPTTAAAARKKLIEVRL